MFFMTERSVVLAYRYHPIPTSLHQLLATGQQKFGTYAPTNVYSLLVDMSLISMLFNSFPMDKP